MSGHWRNPPKNPETILEQGQQGTAGDRLRDLPERVEEFTENLEDTEVPASANISDDSDSEHPAKVASKKYSVHTHISPKKKTKLRGLQANQDHKGSLQKANWRTSTSGRKIW